MKNRWRVRWSDVMVMMMSRQVRMRAMVQMAQPGRQSTSNRTYTWRWHQIGNSRWNANRCSVVDVVMMVVIVQVIIRIGLTCRYATVRCVVVRRTRTDQVLKTQTWRIRHLVQPASIHHWYWIKWWKDLLIGSNVNCFKSVLDTFAAEFRCRRHFLKAKRSWVC